MMEEREPVLCYVSGSLLVFTTQALEDQTGDDWNDAPYEHNAGYPYAYGDHDAKRGKEPWQLVELYYQGDFEQPSSWAYNSPYSIDHINARAVPWLQSDRHGPEPFKHKVWAGWTLRQVAAAIAKAGGMVYAPIDGSVDRWLHGKGEDAG